MSREIRLGTVVSVEEVTRRMRRLVLGGPDIATFATPEGALAPYLKFRLAAPDGEAHIRTYSVRRYDAAKTELHVDVVLHGGQSAGSAFAMAARPGTTVQLGGPGFIPAEPCGAYLLAGDHTALPAIAHILDNLPGGTRVHAIVEVPDRGEELALPSAADARVTWLHRGPSEPSRLFDAVRADWPAHEPDLLVWAGAEAAIARAIRAHARSTCGIPVSRCQVLNYWKLGQPEGGFSYVA